jgi:choline dehydrogenase-like flavoprotein
MVQTGGPAGCTITSALSRSSKRPSVLLFEAASHYSDPNFRIDGQRWVTSQKNPSMNWGYKTVPQEHCLNREIDYSRGQALGGSSTINVSVFTVGAKDDYNEWARLVGNDAFKWKNMQRRFKALETFYYNVPEGGEKYAAPQVSGHGHDGPIYVGYAHEWEKDLTLLLDITEQAGFPINQDQNLGNLIRTSASIDSARGGLRSTAVDTLISPPDNLTIRTNSTVQRVIIKDMKVVGVERDGRKCASYPDLPSNILSGVC